MVQEKITEAGAPIIWLDDTPFGLLVPPSSPLIYTLDVLFVAALPIYPNSKFTQNSGTLFFLYFLSQDSLCY